nr:putative ribonuclease H-like domain-containing protein [Tanacetum cinerariifolium]
MSVRTKRGLGLDKYIGGDELGIDDSKFSVFHTNSDELEGQPIYHRFASVEHMKAVPPPLTGNYMPSSNIPDIDESQMVYGKKAIDSSKIKTNDDSISLSHDSVLFDFSDRSSTPSTNDFQTCDSSQECLIPNHSDHDSNDSISSISTPVSESKDTIVIDCARQENFPSVCTSSIETDVKSSTTLCNKFGSFNKEIHFRKHKSVTSKSCYVCGSYLHLIKDCNFHEQTFTKRNAEGKGILKSRPIGKPVNPNRPKPVFAGRPKPVSAGRPNPISASQPNPVSASQPNTVSAGDGILGSGPLNIQSKSTYFHSITHNNQQIFFPITHNSLYSLYLTGGGPRSMVDQNPRAGLLLKDNSLKLEKAKYKGLVDSGFSRSMSRNKDKLEDFEDFHGGEVTFGGSTGKITWKGTIKTKNLNFENVLYVKELRHFNLISVSQICDQSHMVLFTENECLVLSKYFPLPDPSMVILSILRKHNLYTFSLNELAPKGPLTCLIAKALQNESTLWHRRLGHVNFRNMNKMVKVKAIRCDNGTEFKNANLIELCGYKGIRQDYSNAKTSQQNGVAERKNRTLIEAARTMLADSLLPTIFWSEAVATTCYDLNRVLVTKPHHKTPYKLLTGDKPSISYLKPFGCHVTILNTSDSLGKFDKKSDEGYIVGYSISSKAYRVYNLVSRKIEETMNLNFLKNKPFVVGTGQAWMFDIDYLTDSLNYSRVSSTNLTADNLEELAKLQALQKQEQVGKEEADRLGLAFPSLNPMLGVGNSSISSYVSAGSTPSVSAGSTPQMSLYASPISAGRPTGSAGRPVSAGRPTGSAGIHVSAGRPSGSANRSSVPAGHILGQSNASTSSKRFLRASSINKSDIHDGLMIFDCPKSGIFTSSSYDEDFSGPDTNNVESSLNVSSTITKRIHNIYLTSQVIGDINSLVHTRSHVKHKGSSESAFISYIHDQRRNNHPDFQLWTKWILKNKRDARGIVYRNKARLVAQGHRQEEGIDYTDVFAPVARIEAIRLFLAFASFVGFKVYQIDMKSAFLYGKIAEEVYVIQPRGFEDLNHPKRVYKVVKALYGLHQAPRAWNEMISTFLLKHGYRRGSIDKTFFIKKDSNDIMLVQVYVDDIIFGSTRKDLCEEFETLMQSEIEMSSMGPFTFFLGLQVDQRPDRISIHQEKDANEKKLIQVLKIPTENNVADLLTKSFDVTRFGYLVFNIVVTGHFCWSCDFLLVDSRSCWYALTANLTINASLVRQFWGSASEVSLPDGVKRLEDTIDDTSYTVTKASIRSALQLDDLNATDTPTNAEFLTGFVTKKIFANMRHYQGPDMPLLAHMLNQGEPALVQAQPQESSPSPILFGPAPSSGVASTDPIPEIPSSSRPSEPVLQTITSPIRDDDTGGGSFYKSPPSPPPTTSTRSPTQITTLEAELKATKILQRDAVVLFVKRIKKLERKLKNKKRKLVLSDSKNEEEARQS